MCGVAGFWSSPTGPRGEAASTALDAMASTLVHRGPDADGFWRDDEAGIGLAHRRLSILDLSEAGAQPMVSPCGRYVIAFNGEIYNHLALRDELGAAQPAWRGHSDTETLLAAIARWGVRPALERSAGMFAFALWDRQSRSLTLARDRMGEKPLHYGWVAGNLVFASELKAVRTFPGFRGDIDTSALTHFLRLSCIPGPMTIYSGVSKLMPGHLATFRTPGPGRERLEAYWSLIDVAANGERARWTGAPEEMTDRLEELLADVVESQMLSDVPLGVFLSGGIDSSLVTSLMCARRGASRVRTFSIGFDSARFNEAEVASGVAAHLGTDHTEMTVTEDDALSLVPALPRMFDEPFADSSAIPTALLCALTRKSVTVALSGDGGDEMFGGYNRHISAPRVWQAAARVPASIRRLLPHATAALQPLASGRRADVATRLAQRLGLPKTAADRLAKFGEAVGRADSFEDFYREIVATWSVPGLAIRNPAAAADEMRPWPPLVDPSEQVMAMDALGYLPDDILVKVDRSAMAASLETRAPFLDVRVVEAAWKLPLNAKIAGGTGKTILRDILYRHVPRALVDRPKQGFAVPLDDWLRGRLREWAQTLLSRDALEATALFDVREVQRVWNRHTSCAENAGHKLWAVLMAQAWASEAAS